METTFEITHDREFLQHFLTRWRTLSISPEMVERLKNSDDYYACYGYGRWLYYANPDGNSLKEAQMKLTLAANYGYVADAFAALAPMYYDGTVETDKVNHEMHTFLMYKAQTEGSELAQYLTLFNTIYGDYGFKKDPAEAADILEKHLEKHPDSDPIYWDLLGMAHEQLEHGEAIKYFMKSIEMGNAESYYSLAYHYYEKGDKNLSRRFAEEGMAKGAVNCHRALASFLTQEEFQALPEEKQKELHEEMDRGLHYAVEHHDRRACYILAVYLYYGQVGYEENTNEAIRIAKRGCELGYNLCFELLALIQDTDENISNELQISQKEIAKLFLQSLRMDNVSIEALEKVARAYTANLLPKNDEEIEELWLPKYYEKNIAMDENPSALGVIKIYPQGYFYALEVEQDEFDSLSDLAQFIDADGVDIVHYSEALNRMSKAICRGSHKGYHIAMAVDRDGYAKDLPDNMPGTLLYGHGMEIRGTVILLLEDEKYNLKPIKGLAFFSMCINMLNVATAGLTRYPTDEEVKAIESTDDAFEEYDDSDLIDGDEENEEDVVKDTDNSEKLAETILANVEEMRKNAEEMRIWKNLPIAKETFELIKQVGDDEGPLGRAMGCEMVVDKLSEYDAPRFTLEMLRYELEQLQKSEEESENLTEEDVLDHIAELERFIDIENVSYEDYRKQSHRSLKFDPIERTPLWEEINQEVEAETDALLGDEPRGMGFCFGYWSAKRGVLAKRGIEWRDPHQMNPRVMFD